MKEIVVDLTSSETDYNDFIQKLPTDDCRYAVYDFHYQTEDGSDQYVNRPATRDIRGKDGF